MGSSERGGRGAWYHKVHLPCGKASGFLLGPWDLDGLRSHSGAFALIWAEYQGWICCSVLITHWKGDQSL